MSLSLNALYRSRDMVDCLTNPARVHAFTQDSSAKVATKAGEEFALYDGAVSGSVVEVAENRVRLQWRLRAWPRDHFADVDMSMSDNDNGVRV